MKKILLMLNDLHAGGQEKTVISLLTELVKLGKYDLTLLLVKKQGVFLEDVPAEVKVREVQIPKNVRDFWMLSSRERIKKAIADKDFKTAFLIICEAISRRKSSLKEIVLKAWKAYDRQLPMYADAYDIAIDYQGQGTFPTYYVAKKVKAEKKYTWIHSDCTTMGNDLGWLECVYKPYDQIVAVSEKARSVFDALVPYCAHKSCVCYNVLNREEITTKASAYTVQKKNGINILTVGRLSYEKGYDIALRALARLRDEGKDFTYWVVGDGVERQELTDLVKRLDIEDRVQFAGFQKNPYPIMQMCDIYMQPSRFEGFCLTLGEAKILEKAIITTDFAGASEQITNGVHGLMTECSVEGLYNALKQMLDNPQLCELFRTNIREDSVRYAGLEQFIALVET